MSRSNARNMLPIITEGMAKITMNAVTTIDQTNNGTRFKVIPGARILNAVTMISIAAINPEISVNVIICAHIPLAFPVSRRPRQRHIAEPSGVDADVQEEPHIQKKPACK